MRHRKTPTSGCCGDFWSKKLLLIFTCDDTIFMRFFKDYLNARFWNSLPWILGELAGEGLWLWLLAVCTSTALQLHFNGPSTALQWPFHSTSTALPRPFKGTKKVYVKLVAGCFYPHQSRHSVSPISGIFFYTLTCKCVLCAKIVYHAKKIYIFLKRCSIPFCSFAVPPQYITLTPTLVVLEL